LIFCAARHNIKTDAPKGLRGKDINRHKDDTAGSLGLRKAKAKTTMARPKRNLPTKVPVG
jgi:hypothetical protein